MERKAYKVIKEITAHKEVKVMSVHKDYKAVLGIKVLKVRKVCKEFKEKLDNKAYKVYKAMSELKSVQENARTQSGRIAYRMLDEIAPVLSPVQQQQFTELRKKRTEAWLKQDLGK